MNRTRTALACTAAAGMLVFAAPSHSAAPVSKTISGGIAFQAVLIPNPSPIKDPSCPYIGINIGSGNVPPFGDVGFSSTECVQPNANFSSLKASRGLLVLTTKSGDIINGTYGGTFTFDPTAGKYVASAMPFNIVGGTGAYVRAKGSGTMNISQGAADGVGAIVPTGTVFY